MERIASETMILYAELRERLQTSEAMRSIANLPGEFIMKNVKGVTYHYFQASLLPGRRQIYLGRDCDELRSLIEARRAAKDLVVADGKMFQRLASQIIAGHVPAINSEMARVIRSLADSGIFHMGGVLVGTLAYQILATHLGVIWKGAALMTQDIDLASSARVELATPKLKADVPSVIDSLRMGFFEVPRLSHKEPSTSYAIRGKTLRIDLVTPAKKDTTAPVFLPRLNAAAAPLKFLDYVIEEPIDAVMVAGTPCLVKVPQPGRFALHKLIVSQERNATETEKKRKDIEQARNMIGYLREDRPGDIEIAREALVGRGKPWEKKLQKACDEAGIEL